MFVVCLFILIYLYALLLTQYYLQWKSTAPTTTLTMNHHTMTFLKKTDLVFTGIFLFEFIIKTVAMGFWSNESEHKKDEKPSDKAEELEDENEDD